VNLIKNDVVVTLKEITDLLGIEHNKAIKKVEKLTEEPSFGTVEKIATVYNTRGQTVDTYLLNKKQAIATAAKLDNSMLMKVINHVETLEKKNNSNALINLAKQRELITALSTAQQMTMDVVQDHEDRLDEIERTRRLEAHQEYNLVREKNKKVYEIAGDDKAFANKLHRKVWQLFKKKFSLPRYAELPAVKYEQGIEFVRSLTLADMV